MTSQIQPAVIAAYKAALYIFTGEGIEGKFSPGHTSPEMKQLMARVSATSAVFITAYNPLSVQTEDASNLHTSASLRIDLITLTEWVYPAASSGVSGTWPSELGFLALGVSREDAESLGRKYGQNAIVWVSGDGRAELVLLR